jgi:AraC-like DNA-binding protein
LGFPSFFKFHSLHEIKDDTIEFDHKLIPAIHSFDPNTLMLLDKFFCDKLDLRAQKMNVLLTDMRSKNGKVSIEALARQHFITPRQLERNFKHYVGMSPKEYANFLRYRNAASLIESNRGKRDLLSIALHAGYYDHAHMTNEIRKYAGITPSQL